MMMLEVEIFQGDITQLELDALVNAANDHLWMGGGVAGAIKRAGGVSVEAEAMSNGPVPVGEVVVTTAGSLKAKYVIHAVVMGQDLATDKDKIRQATRNSLLRATELGIESIAFPALGTGVGGFPMEDCACIMINEAMAYPSERTSLKKVVFALIDERSYRVFQRELGKQARPT